MTQSSAVLRTPGGADAWEPPVPRAAATAPPSLRAVSSSLGTTVSLRHVQRAFGSRQVLRGLDLDVAAGEFVAIVGRSGGGKSTLMRLLVGLDSPDGGAIDIGGRPVSGLQGQVRLLFQDPRLLPWKRVLANVGVARGPDWQATARSALADVGLADREQDWPAVLSGGQRQRVALARVLVSRPSVLLLDEPFGALDALTRSEMHDLLARLWQTYGFTILLITHDVSEAIALADRVVVLRDGQVGLDVPIDQPRSLRNGPSPELADLRARILAVV